jgi:Putative S-adenosyl-L-methionine-dependent methyltransferase
MLMRQYIHKRLWDYYAQPASSVVGSITAAAHNTGSSAIPFSRLWGEWHWKHVYGRLYRQSSGQWLTPCELFAPYYSQSLANYIVQRHKKLGSNVSSSSPRLRLVELGGGRGTHALSVLDHLERTAPDLYKTCTYTLLEASPTLHAAQDAVASQSRHGDKMYTHLVDLYTVAMSTITDPEAEFGLISTAMQSDNDDTTTTADPCHVVVMGLEILDNLPHDKIRITRPAAGGTTALSTVPLEQAELVPLHGTTSDDTSDCWQEVFYPLSDPLLQQVLQHYPVHLVSPHTQTVWIPTVACTVLDVLSRQCRSSSGAHHATILLADFDSFGATSPRTESEEGTPIVTNMHDVDHASYLSMTSTPTDILFPTHFSRLALYCESLFSATLRAPTKTDTEVGHRDNERYKLASGTGSAVRIELLRQADFLSRHGPEQVAATSSWLTGYSPMIHDFINCSVLTISVSHPVEK